MRTLMLVLILSWCSFTKSASDFLIDYTRRICNSEPTCSLVNHQNIPPEKRTLLGRNCLCDEDCKNYKDCCVDSPYYRIQEQIPPFPYFCPPTKKVYMRIDCLPSWVDENIVVKCRKSMLPPEDDLSIVTPITNVNTGITYGNVYCAICNDAFNIDNMSEFLPWNLTTRCGELPDGILPSDSRTFPYPARFEIPPSVFLDHNYQIVVNSNFAPGANPADSNAPDANTNATTSTSNGGYYLMDIFLYYVNPGPDAVRKVRSARLPVRIDAGEGRQLARAHRSAPSDPNRHKRLTNFYVDYQKYSDQWPLIALNVRYDPFTKLWISRYHNDDFVCEFDSELTEEGVPVRLCVPNVIDRCPAPDSQPVTFVHGCQTKTAIVFDRQGVPYRNRDCALCNGIPEPDISVCPLW